LEHYRQISELITVLEAEKVKRLAKAKALERFVRELESSRWFWKYLMNSYGGR